MMVFSALALWLSFGAFAFGSSIRIPKEEYRNRDWVAVRNRVMAQTDGRNEFEEALEEIRKAKETRESCDRALRGREIPSPCFSLYFLERNLGLISGEQLKKSLKLLDKICVQRARTTTSRHELAAALGSPDLGEVCRRSIEKRSDKVRYADLEGQTAGVLEGRLD